VTLPKFQVPKNLGLVPQVPY